MKRMLFATMVVSAVFVMASFSTQGFSQPLPDDIEIVEASASVAPKQAAFIGKWTGKWGGSLATILVVEEITDEGDVFFVYSWGKGRNFEPGFNRGVAKFKGDKLTFGTTAKFQFSLRKDGTMRGRRTAGGGTVTVKLKRVEEGGPL